jgi:hypothetical protein
MPITDAPLARARSGVHCDQHRRGYQHKPNGAHLRKQTAPSPPCPGKFNPLRGSTIARAAFDGEPDAVFHSAK